MNNITEPELDVVVIGAGFGGCYLLKRLRDFGFRVRVFEEAEGLGGVWWHNRYPGARIDNSCPFYEYSDPEIWNEWSWTESYPAQPEILKYFEFVDSKWNLTKDITFGSKVTDTAFDGVENKWTIHTSKGHVVRARFLLLAIGFAAKSYTPQFKGLDTFQGTICHPAKWPEQDTDLKGRRIGIMGTGASGVQIIQELAPIAAHTVVFQRSPNCALPMRQQTLVAANEMAKKKGYPELFKQMKLSSVGFDFSPIQRKCFDDTPEVQRALFEEVWVKGGFQPSHGNYAELSTDLKVNHLFYRFWRDKIRERLTNVDAETLENLAPWDPPYPFGTKRPSLEQNYFEVFNNANVSLVNLKKNPIAKFTADGVWMANGQFFELDALVLATGYDAITGSFSRINIQGLEGQKLNDKWSAGTRTSLGIATAGFPNMFFLYGPQSPTAYAVGPVILEIQADWVIKVLLSMRDKNLTSINATHEAEAAWSAMVADDVSKTLVPLNETTWYMGGNIPGKPREALNYVKGLPAYQKHLYDCLENEFAGFVLK